MITGNLINSNGDDAYSGGTTDSWSSTLKSDKIVDKTFNVYGDINGGNFQFPDTELSIREFTFLRPSKEREGNLGDIKLTSPLSIKEGNIIFTQLNMVIPESVGIPNANVRIGFSWTISSTEEYMFHIETFNFSDNKCFKQFEMIVDQDRDYVVDDFFQIYMYIFEDSDTNEFLGVGGDIEKLSYIEIKEASGGDIISSNKTVNDIINMTQAEFDIAVANDTLTPGMVINIPDTGGAHSMSVPIGVVLASPLDSIGGYLLCDGQEASRTEYVELFTAIGTTYGEGNGTTTFNVPDFRGLFLRGYGGNSDEIGIVQNDELKSHTHIQNAHTHTANHNHTATTSSAGSASGSFSRASGAGTALFNGVAETSGIVSNASTATKNNFQTLSETSSKTMGIDIDIPSHTHSVTVATRSLTTSSTTGVNQNTGGVETRPVNQAINYFIKAKSDAYTENLRNLDVKFQEFQNIHEIISYKELASLGLSKDNTLSEICLAMPNHSFMAINISSEYVGSNLMNDMPSVTNPVMLLTISRQYSLRTDIELSHNIDSNKYAYYKRSFREDNGLSPWYKILTEEVT